MLRMKHPIIVEFYGPFSWHGLDETIYIFDHELAQRSGVYLWTVKHQGEELVFYVGETGRSFATRLYEHYIEQIPGGYSIYDPDEFKNLGTNLKEGEHYFKDVIGYDFHYNLKHHFNSLTLNQEGGL